MVYLHVVLGEMVPKNLALAGPDRAALLLAPPLVWCARATGPLARGLNAVAKTAVRLLGVEPKDEVTSAFTADEVASILAESRREGLIEDQQGLLTGALAFAGRDAGEAAVPLADLVAPDRARPRRRTSSARSRRPATRGSRSRTRPASWSATST